MFKNAEFFVHKYIKNEINYKEVVGLMQGKQQQDFRTEKYIRYGIRKYSFGAASVAIAAGLMFLGNGAVSATEVQGAETSVAAATAPANQADSNKEKEAVKPETKVEEAKPEVKAEEAKKVNKAVLEASIATLESKLSTAKYADATVVSSAKEVLAAAKATLAKADASQADVDAQAETVSALSTVVTESNTAGFDKKKAAEKEAAKAEVEKKSTPAEKTLSEAKSALDKASSEADVTNRLAKSELSKKEVKEENKAAVEAAVAKNQAVFSETKALLAEKSVTKEQVDAQLERLNESILAVYNELKNAGIGRDGKFAVNLEDAQTTALKDATAETGAKWLEQNGYKSLAEAPKYIKGNADDDKAIKNLNNQIQWLDFGDDTAWTNRKANKQLQVGSVYEKELMPGYIVKMTVKELKPFHATEIYKNRVAGTSHEASYKPNEENIFNQVTKNPFSTGISGNQQTGYTHVKNAGLDTGSAKTTIAGTDDSGTGRDGQIVGVKFAIEATYNGKPVKPGIVMTSGEDIGSLETEIYTTNGTPWELAGVVGSTNGHTDMYKPHPNFNRLNEWGGNLNKWTTEELRNAIDGKMFATKDAATAGLGSQVFGGYTNGDSATPVVSTSNVTEVGFYIMSSGQQSSMIGIKFSDFGDLPESYGTAEHYLRTQAKDYITGQINQIQQPYLGTVKADIDSVSGTRVRGVDSDDTKEQGDEGVAQLIAPEDVHINKDNGEPEVKLVQAADNTYRVKVIASANGNDNYDGTVGPAYVRGFIDFNGNGKFDEGEASEVVTVNGNQQTVELVFKNTQVIDTTKDAVNFRTRIATDRKQIEKPVGIAFSGEVEDNQIQVSIPPRGDKEETTGKQGETQSVGIEFVSHALGDDASNLGSNNGKTTFNSYGKLDYSEQANSISAETTKKKQPQGVMIVDPSGNLVKSYTKAGQGTYTVLEDKVIFTPEANFIGTADGVVLRAVDANGHSTGWTALTDQHDVENINDGTHTTGTKTMDAVYIPTVTPKEITADPETSTDVQGKEQKKTPTFTAGAGTENPTPVTPSAQYPAKLVDPKTGDKVDSVTVEGEGTYTINPTTGEVTFQPLPTFTGTASGVGVSLTAPVGQDKDGNPVTATATTTYTPTVTAVTPTADPATSTGVQGETQKGTPTFTEGNSEVPIKENSHKLLDKEGNEVPAGQTTPAYAEDGVTPVGTYSIDPATGEVTFTPTDKSYTGKVTPAKVQAEDKNGTKVSTTYTPNIVGVTPTADPAKSVDIQGATQENTVSFEPGKTTIAGEEKTVEIDPSTYTLLGEDGQPATEVPAKDPNGKVIGKYTLKTVDGKAVAVFEPTDKTYSGEVQPVKIQAKDKNGTAVETTYTPLITPVTPTAEPAETTDIQGKEQTGKPTFTPGNPNVPMDDEVPATFEDGSKEKVIPGEGTYTVAPDGTVTFTPEKGFTGKGTGVTVKRVDKNGTPVTAKYTPTVTPVTPTADPAETTDIQGKEQTGKPTFTPGNPNVPMDDEVPATFEDGSKEKVIPGEGTYTVAPDGTVTFTPEKGFTGKGTGVTVKRVDKNGTPVTAKYTPTVTPVTPTAEPAETTDIQGKEQTGKPTFTPGNPNVPMDDDTPATFEDGSKEKVIPGEGTYTVAPDGTVTFTPEKGFTGKGTGVTVKRVDKNGTPVTAKYTPTVAPVTPTGIDAVTEDVQGSTQTGKPTFEGGKVTVNGEEKTVEIDEDKPAKLVDPKTGDPVDSVTIEGEGTYTVSPDGTVTFTPEKNFTGKGTGVTVQREDKNGTPVKATYTPVVKPAIPTSSDVITTNVQGATQSGTPTFEGGKVTVNGEEKTVEIDETVKPTFDDGTTEKKVPGEGTYTIDENGTVTFTPEKNFTGQATGVTVKRVDKNGTPITAKYTPVVVPVSPTSKDTESEGPKGQPQSGTPTFEGGKVTINGKEVPVEIDETVKPTFDDGTTEKKVPGEGTYTIDENGKVTFTPEPDFVGKAKGVTVKRVDKNGTPVTATYTPTVRPDTSFVDKDGNPLSPTEDGTKPTKDIPGYKIVKTEIDEKGNTKHIYEKVTTTYKDKDGNVIPNYPTEDGEQPKKDIPGYRFVETKKLPNGDTEHVYEKVKTSFKDKEGNEIPGNPSEDGDQPKKDIPGYRFVETKKLPNGDIEHVYEKVKTSHKDKDGNEIPNYPTEDGDQPKKDIPGYRFVETKKLPNGDIEHVYEKVTQPAPTPSPVPQPNPGKQNTTIWTDENGNPLKPTEPGSKEPGTIPGYEYVKTVTDPAGTIKHIFRKVEMPTPVDPSQPVQPVEPATPAMPEQPAKPQVPATPAQPAQPTAVKEAEGKRELPNTGTEDHANLAALGLLGVLSGFGLVARKKKED